MTTKLKSTELRIVAGEFVDPTPRREKVRLHSIDDIRLELARVYNDMRDGKLDPSNGTKMAYVLGQMVRIFETREIDQRTLALERTLRLQIAERQA